MHVHNLYYQSPNDAMSDPNVTSLFLTLTEPAMVKANYRLEKSQKTLPATTANELLHHYPQDSPTQWMSVHTCAGQWALHSQE